MELETKQLQDAVQTVIDSKLQTEQQITEVKSTLETLATKDSVEQLQTKNTNLESTIDDLKEQVANLEVKGHYNMETPQAKTFNLNTELKSHVRGLSKQEDIFAVKAGMNTQDQASAGVTIRTEYEAGIIKPLRERSAFLGLMSHKTVSAATYKRLVRIKGAEMRWGGENVGAVVLGNTGVPGYSEVEGSFGKAEAKPYITTEMINDGAFDLVGELYETVTDEMAVGINRAMLLGDGVKQPLGFLNRTTGAAHEKFEVLEIGAAGALPAKTADFVKAIRAVMRQLGTGYRPNAKFVMNEAMRDAVAGYVYTDGRSVLQYDITDAPEGQLLSKSIIVDCEMPDDTFIYGDIAQAFTSLTVEGLSCLVNPFAADGVVSFYHSMRVGTIVGDVNAAKIVKIKAA
jgi:HK97 family phage major capsid protein